MSSDNRVDTISSLSRSVVKSAARVLKILEYFENVHCEANVIEICRALDYPQSSTSVLLRTMVALGYLQYNVKGRTYIPASKVALLGTWVNRALFRDGNIYRLFDKISELTDHPITVAVRNGAYLQYIHSAQLNAWGRPCHVVGTTYALTSRGSGLAILSTLSEAEAGKIIRRLNSEAPNPDQRVNIIELMRRLCVIRAQGYALASDPVVPDQAEIAMPLSIGGGMAHAIAICGSYKDLAADRTPLVDVLRQAIAAYLDGSSDREQIPAGRYAAEAQPVTHAIKFADGTKLRLHDSDGQSRRPFLSSSTGSPGGMQSNLIKSVSL
jgi:DNA-binding IclR family transcriptional regulator